MGKNMIDVLPGCSPFCTICMKPDHRGLGTFSIRDAFQIKSSGDSVWFSKGKLIGSYFREFKRLSVEVKLDIWTLPTAAMSSDIACSLCIGFVVLVLGVTIAIIPILWKVFSPSMVQILWSTLSAAYWVNGVVSSCGISMLWDIAALCSKHLTSEYDAQNPCLYNVSLRNFDWKWLCTWTPRPICNGANNTWTSCLHECLT